MNYSLSLKGDINNNGKIDNDKEARANIAFNAKDIQELQNELKRLKKKVNVDYNISSMTIKDNANFASSAKMAEELNDGKQRVFFNNVNKSVVFKNSNKPLSSCVQIGTNDNSIKNLNEISLNHSQPIKSFVQTYTGFTEQQQQQSIPSIKVINDIVDNLASLHVHEISDVNGLQDELDGKSNVGHGHEISDISNLQTSLDGKSNVNHQHKTDEIYEEYEEEETVNEEIVKITKTRTLDTILTNKADIIHNHDERYALLNNIVSEIQNIVSNTDSTKIPNITAIKSYCSDFISATSLRNNQQLQNLIRGKSAFEIWKEQQTPKQEGEEDYTINDFINSIGGQSAFDIWKEQQTPKQEGEEDYTINDFLNAIRGPQGNTGLSAFGIWKAEQPPKNPDYTVNDYLNAIKGPKGNTGADGKSAFQIWKEQQPNNGEGKTESDFLDSLKAKDSVGEQILSYGLDAVSFLASLYGDYGLQTQLTALQAQVSVLEDEITTMLGEDNAADFIQNIHDARNTALSLSDYLNIWKNRFSSGVNTVRRYYVRARGYLQGYSALEPTTFL